MREKDEQNSSPVSFEVSITRLPQKGMPVVFEADARQREALADVHSLLSVDRFRAELLVTSWKRNGVKVTGKVHAAITQQCVVTLEPVASKIDEEFEQIFVPEGSKLARIVTSDTAEMVIDPDGPDLPEMFIGDTIDVGEVVAEFAALAIDAYPREPGAEFADHLETDADEKSGRPNPFAVLKDWKKD
jgi:uncharacterized metal-binding protein YceD (DUF177 family)